MVVFQICAQILWDDESGSESTFYWDPSEGKNADPDPVAKTKEGPTGSEFRA